MKSVVQQWIVTVILAMISCVVFAPTRVLNTLTVTNPTVLHSEPHFFLASHDFEHMDLFTMLKQASVWQRMTKRRTHFVVADRPHNHLLATQNKLRRQSVDFLFVRGGTVDIVHKLLSHSNVCMFLYRDVKATGAYHIVKNFRGPIVLVRIVSNARCCTGHEAVACVKGTVGHTYGIELTRNGTELKQLIVGGISPPAFVQHVKKTLYPDV